jgi:flagellin-specific chaperone FliS
VERAAQLMLALRSPHEAYARVELDARVAGASQRDLVALCYERLASGIGAALHADARGDTSGRSRSLTRALSALTALQLGLDPAAAVAPAIERFLSAARQVLLDSAVRFDPQVLGAVRSDVAEIAGAMLAA